MTSITQETTLNLFGSHGGVFLVTATANSMGVKILIVEDGPISKMFTRDVFSKEMPWDEFNEYSQLSFAAYGVLRENGVMT